MSPTSDELIALTEARFLGTAERTDALLDELWRIGLEQEATKRWQFYRRWRLQRDMLAYVAELRRNERIRAWPDRDFPGLSW